MNEKNLRKKLSSLILLLAFTGLMLIVSTYAWFTTQSKGLLKGLEGKVEVSDGLQISLDAKTWTQTIDFSEAFTKEEGVWTSSKYLPTEGATFQAPYSYVEEGTTKYGYNVTPEYLEPVSTTGGTNEGIGLDHIKMYAGLLSEGIKLSGINEIEENENSPYYAFDLFIQNTGSIIDEDDVIKLNTNSSVVVTDTSKNSGLQNTVRVGFALYENNIDNVSASQAEKNAVTVSAIPTVDEIISGTVVGKNIKDVAIWEPNADNHVQPILDSNNNVKFSVEDIKSLKYGIRALAGSDVDTLTEGKVVKFSSNTIIPTYGLKTSSVGQTINNIYDWDNPTTMRKQHTLATETAWGSDERDTAQSLLSIKAVENEETEPQFKVGKGQYQRIRVYIWLEGQDVDCTNYASLGGGVNVQIGLTKNDGVRTEVEDRLATTYRTAMATNSNNKTIAYRTAIDEIEEAGYTVETINKTGSSTNGIELEQTAVTIKTGPTEPAVAMFSLRSVTEEETTNQKSVGLKIYGASYVLIRDKYYLIQETNNSLTLDTTGKTLEEVQQDAEAITIEITSANEAVEGIYDEETEGINLTTTATEDIENCNITVTMKMGTKTVQSKTLKVKVIYVDILEDWETIEEYAKEISKSSVTRTDTEATVTGRTNPLRVGNTAIVEDTNGNMYKVRI